MMVLFNHIPVELLPISVEVKEIFVNIWNAWIKYQCILWVIQQDLKY